MSESYFDAMAPLTHPDVPPYLHRRVGVQVVDRLDNHPGLGGKPAYQVESEAPSLNTMATASWVAAEKLDERITERLRWVVDRLDASITEQWRHRERLATELLRRTGEYPELPQSLKRLRENESEQV